MFLCSNSFLSLFLEIILNVCKVINSKCITEMCKDTYATASFKSNALSNNESSHIHGFGEFEHGFCDETAFVLRIKAFLKLSLLHSVGVDNLSKLSLDNFTAYVEYLS